MTPSQRTPGRLVPLHEADLSRVEVVFTDVDGTLTTKGQLQARTLRALEWLVADGVEVVLVSGRPAGWGEAWARQWPVRAVIVENGGLAFVRGADGKLRKDYPQGPAARKTNRARLLRDVAAAMRHVKGTRLSMDSVATEVDIAIDYAEDVSLGHGAADALEAFLTARGVTAVRSSVHVNCWIGRFDKRTAVERLLRRTFGTSLRPNDGRFVYVGDSFNDEPMFAAFPLSIGVANVRDVLDRLAVPPRFVTSSREGKGFVEVADAVVRARRAARGQKGKGTR